MGEKVMFLFMLLAMIICGGCNGGEVYKVGGSSGWTNTNITPFHYKSWSASKVFHVGDTLCKTLSHTFGPYDPTSVFEYNKEFHNVVRVTHKNFNTCNSTSPYATWATGNDSFTIRRPGHFYFICSFPGHCWDGQKVDIRVPGHRKPRPATSPSPSGPSPSGPSSSGPSPPTSCPPHQSGPSPVAVPPAHSRRSGSSSLHSYSKLWLFLVAIALPAIAS